MVTTTVLLLAALVTQTQPPPKTTDLNTVMMGAALKILGPGRSPGETMVGTGFLVGRPTPTNPKQFYYVLVTAAHVLKDIQGPSATLILRVKSPVRAFVRYQHQIAIRDSEGGPMWTEHPITDVAAMYVALPDTFAGEFVPTSFLATDSDYEKYEFHPGDEVFTVGYPYGLEASAAGFPILRSGRIASYPLVPAKEVKKFLVDFSVFGGNSGGPIYINEHGRLFGNSIHFDERVFRVLGLVVDQVTRTATGERLNVAGVVHAQFIRDTIDLLPPTQK